MIDQQKTPIKQYTVSIARGPPRIVERDVGIWRKRPVPIVAPKYQGGLN